MNRPGEPVSAPIDEILTMAAALAAEFGRHPPDRLAAADQQPGGVDRQDPHRLLEGIGVGGPPFRPVDAGVVDQPRHRTESRVGRLEHPQDVGLGPDVGLHRDRLAARCHHLGDHALGQFLRGHVVHHHARAPGAELPRRRGPDAAACACHDDNFRHGTSLLSSEGRAWAGMAREGQAGAALKLVCTETEGIVARRRRPISLHFTGRKFSTLP